MLKIALKLMADKWLRCLKSDYVRFKHYERKPKWPFMIYKKSYVFENCTKC